MGTLVRPRRWLPWLACTVCLVGLLAWGCGNGATDAPSSPEPERRARPMAALLSSDGGDDAASGIDAGDASAFGDAGTGAPCTNDSVCIPTDYCASTGTCQPQLGTGATCDTTAGGDCRVPGCRQCTSNDCDNGVCCGSGCQGCETCSAALQQPFADGGTPGNGVCGPVLTGTDPHEFCPTPTPDSCKGNGLCNGEGACQTLSPAGTPCGNPTCAGTSTTTERCNGLGTCTPSSISCAPYACELGSCVTTCATNTDCASPATCNLGACGTGAANGTTCDTNANCASGFCVDGVCCNSACPQQCQACDVSGQIGTCTVVSGAPHGARAPCAGQEEDGGNACAGACDGANTAACAYPGATTTCGPSCSGSTFSSGSCSGDGGCGSFGSFPCQDNYACQSATACNTSCQKTTDCATGAVCAGGACTTLVSVCAGNTSVSSVAGEDAGVISCGAYLCLEDAGACTTSCKSASECAPGATCSAQGECGTGTSKSGCSCDTVGAGGASGGAWALAMAFGLLATRRRRRE